MLGNVLIELTGNAANCRFVSDVRGAEAARSHAAQVTAKFSNYSGLAHAPGLHRRCHSCGRASVNTNIRLDNVGAREGASERAKEQRSKLEQSLQRIEASPSL